MKLQKERTIGLLGQKGTGKTYLTRKLIESINKDCLSFDTIGALKPKNARSYRVSLPNIKQQTQILSGIVQKTSKNININLSQLTQAEIVAFTNAFLRITPLDDKFVFIDEIHDYTPESGKRSHELERLVRHGRNVGITFVFNSHRPASVSKSVLSLTDVLVCFRLVWSRDIDVIKNILNNLGVTDIDGEIHRISNQQVGEYRLYEFAKSQSFKK